MGRFFRSRTAEGGGVPPRIKQVILGGLLGFGWGTLMWLITGADGGSRVWLYIAITTAMIGGGVAAIFGAVGVRRRGERVSPRVGKKK
ncbi:MAG: hypothetical protein MUE51_01565 [Thermoleophilia bacterium]|nr:hypothetical protein [Thermoleophilia bacterium]